MKKAIIVCLALAFILCIHGGCKYNLDVTSEEKISIENASDIVRQALPNREYEYHIEYERETTVEGKAYYVFHVFTVSSQMIDGTDGNEPFQMQFTYGFYYVDPIEKELFQLSVGGDHLIKVETGDG